MPRNVRNFWLTLEVDGKKEKVATGPRNANGGFYLTILVRENGEVSDKSIVLEGKVSQDGSLIVLMRNGAEHSTLLKSNR